MIDELQHFHLDQTQFVAPMFATQEFFGSIVERFFNDVTGEFDAVSAKAYFDAWIDGACEMIIAHVLSEGGAAIDCVNALETFRHSLSAGLHQVQ